MSVGITLLLVHTGSLYKWNKDYVITISGIAAFLSKEFLNIIVHTSEKILHYIVEKIYPDGTDE